jgi:nucleoid-associated protein YgaU
MTARLRALGFVLLVSGAIVTLQAAGSGALAGPPSFSATAAVAWLRGTDPVVVTFALLRLLALGLGWYVLVVTLAGGTARALRAKRLTRAVDALTLPGIRRMLNAAGVAVIVSTALPASVAWASPGPGPTSPVVSPSPLATPLSTPPVMHWIGTSGPLTDATSALSGTATTTSLPSPSVSPASAPSRTPDFATPATAAPNSSSTGAPGAPVRTGAARPLGPVVRPLGPETGRTSPRTADSVPSSNATTWTVQSGDDFWQIAESSLAAAWGRAPSDREIVPYWLSTIQANTARLAVPSEPSFIYPGQVFVLPPLPAAPPAQSS